METWDDVKAFWDYLVFFPYDDEPDYDGVHDGGIKGIRDDAPEQAKKAFEEWQKTQDELKSRHIKD